MPSGRRLPLPRWPAVGLAVALLASAGATQLSAQNVHLPDNVVEGFGAVRVENEFKLVVPDSLVTRVWDYLRTRYTTSAEPLDLAGHRLRSAFGDEVFIDVYYDAPGRPLLDTGSGIRHRSRFMTGDTATRGEARELVQLKMNLPGEMVSRAEVKFSVRHYPEIASQEDAHPLLGIISRGDRAEFQRQVRALGIDPWQLRESLTLQQRRRRIYLSDDGGPFATLTLDQTSSRRWWLRTEFTELELELNEIRYTASGEAARAEMEAVTAAVRADLQREFPQIVQDQTPKYNKAFAGLEASSVAGRGVMRANFTVPQAVTVLGLSMLFMYALFALLQERRVARRTPVRPPVPTRAERPRTSASGARQ